MRKRNVESKAQLNSRGVWWVKRVTMTGMLKQGETLAAGRPVLHVDVLREEQRAMPAYEEPPVLPGGSFFGQRTIPYSNK